MESDLASEYVNRRASGVVMAVEYADATKEIVGTTIIAVLTSCSSLSIVSQLTSNGRKVRGLELT
jgi:hypothetical protein